MSRVLLLLSSSCVVLVILLVCLSQECNGRHLSSFDDHDHDHAMDDKAKVLSHSSTIKGLGNHPIFPLHGLKMTAKGKKQKQTDSESMNQKDMMIKDQKVKEVKDLDHHQHHTKSITFRVPLKHGQMDEQPGFNLDYSPPKTHPPSHN